MNAADVQWVERELGLKLPAGYVDFLLSYPADLGGPCARQRLINEPERLVKVNRSVRRHNQRHRRKDDPWEWPDHLFVIGESSFWALTDEFEEEKCCYAVDVRDKQPQVLHLSVVSGGPALGDWSFCKSTLREFVQEVRAVDAPDEDDTDESPRGRREKTGQPKAAGRTSARQPARKRSPTLDEIYAIADDGEFMNAMRARWENRLKKTGYDKLTEGEQRLTRLQGFCWEVNGNGFEGFFENSIGDHAEEIYRDLRLVGAAKNARQLKSAMRLFPGGEVPKDQDDRQRLLEQMLENERIEAKFSKLLSDPPDEDLPALITAYVRNNRPHFEEP